MHALGPLLLRTAHCSHRPALPPSLPLPQFQLTSGSKFFMVGAAASNLSGSHHALAVGQLCEDIKVRRQLSHSPHVGMPAPCPLSSLPTAVNTDPSTPLHPFHPAHAQNLTSGILTLKLQVLATCEGQAGGLSAAHTMLSSGQCWMPGESVPHSFPTFFKPSAAGQRHRRGQNQQFVVVDWPLAGLLKLNREGKSAEDMEKAWKKQ